MKRLLIWWRSRKKLVNQGEYEGLERDFVKLQRENEELRTKLSWTNNTLEVIRQAADKRLKDTR